MVIQFLKMVSFFLVMVGLLHLVLGLEADVLLGAVVSPEALSDPVLDSQNRFYGVAFSVYGFLLYLCATDVEKYQTVLRVLLWVFFTAGCARLVSMAVYGLPSSQVLFLLSIELTLPPIGVIWINNAVVANSAVIRTDDV